MRHSGCYLIGVWARARESSSSRVIIRIQHRQAGCIAYDMAFDIFMNIVASRIKW